MTGAEAAKKWDDERRALMDELLPLGRDEKEKLILAATEYRSGEDSCGSVYMGSIAHAGLSAIFRRPYGTCVYKEVIPLASDDQINAGLFKVANIIKYMREHPKKKCPCCGQITDAI